MRAGQRLVLFSGNLAVESTQDFSLHVTIRESSGVSAYPPLCFSLLGCLLGSVPVPEFAV